MNAMLSRLTFHAKLSCGVSDERLLSPVFPSIEKANSNLNQTRAGEVVGGARVRSLQLSGDHDTTFSVILGLHPFSCTSRSSLQLSATRSILKVVSWHRRSPRMGRLHRSFQRIVWRGILLSDTRLPPNPHDRDPDEIIRLEQRAADWQQPAVRILVLVLYTSIDYIRAPDYLLEVSNPYYKLLVQDLEEQKRTKYKINGTATKSRTLTRTSTRTSKAPAAVRVSTSNDLELATGD